MTIDEELALLKSGIPAEGPPMALGKLQDDTVAPMVQLDAVPAPVTMGSAADAAPQKDADLAAPAAAPAEIKPESEDASPWSDDVPPPAKGLKRLPGTDAGTWDVMSAAWVAETVRTDAFNYSGKMRDNLAWDMFDLLPKDAQDRILEKRFDPRVIGAPAFEDMVLAEVPAAAEKDPQTWGKMPSSRDAFDAQINKARLDTLNEAQTVLDQPGGGFAEFIGASARSMTDEVSLMLLPLGLGGGAVRTVLSEAALGGLGEAAILPRENRVAQELDLPTPDAFTRILTGVALGGGLSAGVLGIVKGVGLMRARRTATRDAMMGEGNHLDAEIAIDRAEADLTGQKTPQQRMKDRVAGSARPAKDVVIEYDLGGKTRDKPVSDAFQMSLQSSVAPLGDDIGVVITSGGQDPIGSGGKRTGSTRHDVDDTGHSQTADVVLTRNGRRVTPKEDPQLYADFLFNAGSRFPGIGHYDWGVHVGGGSVASWGPDTTASTLDPFFGDAIAAGRAGRSDWTSGAVANTPGLNYNEDATLDAIIGAESGGRASVANDSSSALGAAQYLGDTWLELVQRHRPDLLTGRTPNEVLALRTDPVLSREMLKLSAREGHDALTAAGLPSGPAEIYLTHFMGTAGATRALKADLEAPISSVMGRKQIADNASIRFNGKQFADFTVFDLRQWSRSKMRRAYGGAPSDAPNTKPTSRSYTGGSQITAGGQMRIDVDYEVVDIASLKNAAGDLQPRDRSQQNSTLQVQDIAARLDPAQLMPSPNAAYGTPIVGRDGIIDSGNGRTMGLALAYNQMPDRAAAYRGAIEKAGFAIPEGVTQPVLIARRKTDFTPEERSRFNELAQDSGVARMTAAEVSRFNRHAMTPATMGKFDLSARFNAPENDGWVRDVVAALPASERNAMFTDGRLNTVGRAQVREALFARAWPDRDILRRFLEDDPGELKSLMEALDEAAPSWAALRAEIEAGTVAPEMDISGHVLDAMRLIAEARDLARREKLSIASAISEMLDDVDILQGAVAPLTIALVRKFWKGGKAARADDVASFLTRYADDARKGAGGGLFDAPTPRDILQSLDPETFADLPDDLGPVRGYAVKDTPAPPRMADGYENGAASPDAEAADLAARDALEAPDMFDAEAVSDLSTLDLPTPDLPAQAAPDFEATAARDAMAAAQSDLGDDLTDMTFKLEDGTEVSFREVLDDLDLDANLAAAVRACAIGGK